VTEWDSALFGVDVHVRTIVTKEHLYTEYGRAPCTKETRVNLL